MVINYLKLRYKIYINRIKRKPKEEVLGEVFGYIAICGFFSVILYLIFKKIFDGVEDKILPIIFINFILLVIISFTENFKYIYKTFFEAADKEILFSLPCKNIDIIAIKYIENLINFWKIFLFFYLPCLIAFLSINRRFFLAFIFLIISLNLIGVCIISFLYIILISAIYISKGKNIKMTSFIISACITGTVFIIIIFFSDSINISFLNKGGISYLLLLPLKITSNLMFNFKKGILFYLEDISILIAYTSIAFVLTSKVISKAINDGYLLMDTETVSKLPIVKVILGSTIIRKLKNLLMNRGITTQNFAIVEKDIILLFCNLNLIKLLLTPLFFIIIFDLKMKFSSNGMDLLIVIIVKSVWSTISLCYFVIESEKENFYLILNSGIRNIDIIKSKVLSVSFILVPLMLVFDIFLIAFHNTNGINSIYFITTDILILIFISIISITIIFQYSSVSMTRITIEFNGGLMIFLSILLYIIPTVIINYIILKTVLNVNLIRFRPICGTLVKLFSVLSFFLITIMFFRFTVKKSLEKSESVYHEIN